MLRYDPGRLEIFGESPLTPGESWLPLACNQFIKEFGKINSYSKYLQKALESIDKKKKLIYL